MTRALLDFAQDVASAVAIALFSAGMSLGAIGIAPHLVRLFS